MSARKAKLLLGLIMVLHFLLAVAYDCVTPYHSAGISNGQHLTDIGAPDELAHTNYIGEVLEQHRWPMFNPNDPHLGEHYENHQPPLFYATEALTITMMGGEALWNSPTSPLVIRTVNALIGAATVAAVFFLALWATNKPSLALFAAGFTSLLPMFCALSGAVSNDPMLFLWMTWCLAFLVRACRGWTVGVAILVGLFAGLAILTKTTGIVLLPVIFLTAFLSTSRARLIHIVIALLIPIAINLPWWIRNEQLYHDPLALSVFQHGWPAVVHPAEWAHNPRGFLHWAYVLLAGLALSFVGEFGYMDIHLPYWIYIPALVSLLLLLWRGLRAPARAARSIQPSEFSKQVEGMPAAVWWVLGAYTLLIFAVFIQFNLSYVQPQARYIFPAIGPIATWIALGVFDVGRSSSGRKLIGGAMLCALFFANVYALAILPEEFRKREVQTPIGQLRFRERQIKYATTAAPKAAESYDALCAAKSTLHA